MSSKLHAEHNEDLCTKIISLNDFDDWVITTAFYACIHYVEHKLFPLSENGINYPTFNRYYNDTVIASGKRTSKHTLKFNLVKAHLSTVDVNYKRLMDNCLTARYSNYRIGKTLAQIAISDMAKVKSACT